MLLSAATLRTMYNEESSSPAPRRICRICRMGKCYGRYPDRGLCLATTGLLEHQRQRRQVVTLGFSSLLAGAKTLPQAPSLSCRAGPLPWAKAFGESHELGVGLNVTSSLSLITPKIQSIARPGIEWLTPARSPIQLELTSPLGGPPLMCS